MEFVEQQIFSKSRALSIRDWKRFVDDVWALVPRDEVDRVLALINNVENTINFTIENEENNSLPFLDVKVIRNKNGSFSSDV